MNEAGITFDTMIALGLFVVVSAIVMVLVHEWLIWTERFRWATAVLTVSGLSALAVLDQILVHLGALPYP